MAQNKSNPVEHSKPVVSFRSGALSVSVWEREGKQSTFFTANAQRAYTEDDGKTWEYSSSFNQDDFPVVASLLLQAHAWIVAQRKESGQ